MEAHNLDQTQIPNPNMMQSSTRSTENLSPSEIRKNGTRAIRLESMETDRRLGSLESDRSLCATQKGKPNRAREGRGRPETDLGLGLDADVEGLDACGEGARDALPGEGVEEVEARVGEAEEAAPLLHHRHAGLVHAPAEEEEGVHHLARPSTWSGVRAGDPSSISCRRRQQRNGPVPAPPPATCDLRPCVWVDRGRVERWKEQRGGGWFSLETSVFKKLFYKN